MRRLIDGSGLSTDDRLSAHQLVGLLAGAPPRTPTWFYRLVAAGRRQRHALQADDVRPGHRNARAKTGTLDDASTLSGYVTARNGHQIVFSILVNRRHLNITAAHALQDRIVQLLAASAPG